MHIDETRRNGEPVCIDDPSRGLAAQLPHAGDPAAAYSNIADVRRISCAVDDAAMQNQGVEFLRQAW